MCEVSSHSLDILTFPRNSQRHIRDFTDTTVHIGSPQMQASIANRDNHHSFWKPLSGPVKDWPLALCSPRTVKPERDFEPCDLVYPDYVVENRQVYYSTDHDWFYISDQQPNEAWVFLQSDTELENKPGMHKQSLTPPPPKKFQVFL